MSFQLPILSCQEPRKTNFPTAISQQRSRFSSENPLVVTSKSFIAQQETPIKGADPIQGDFAALPSSATLPCYGLPLDALAVRVRLGDYEE
jgi:hypothetical protein